MNRTITLPASPRARARRRRTAVALVVSIPLLAVLGAGAFALGGAAGGVLGGAPGGGLGGVVGGLVPAGPPSEADGFIEEGEWISLDDEHLPAISKLDPALLAAIRAAEADANADGIEFRVTSGWRSAAYQQRLLDDAVGEYGSLDEARRFVNTPEESRHVTGEAIDIGPTDADSWLSQHGADYGLCQIYANEMWHFELVIEPGGVCPMMLEDARS